MSTTYQLPPHPLRQAQATQAVSAAINYSPDPERQARQRRAHRLALRLHTSPAVTPAELRSREKSLLRELDAITNELRDVRHQLKHPAPHAA